MAIAVPLSLLGETPSQETPPQGQPDQGPPAAILHTQGGVWVNGAEARDSTAVFVGDVLETKPGFSATLNLEGSEIVLAPESIVKLQAEALELDHGSVSVGTSKTFNVLVNCIRVLPVLNEWTQYEVTDLNGTAQVAARKNDVSVETGARGKSATPGEPSGTRVHEGEQKNFVESEVCGPAHQPWSPGNLNNPKWIAAGAAATGILIWILVHNGGPPASPSDP
jgi:hypothetical protein